MARPRSKAPSRAVKMRAAASAAREAVDTFKGDPLHIPEDKARWEQVCRVATQTEAAAARAEKAEAQRAKKAAERATAGAAIEREHRNSGTKMVPSADAASVARVAQCRTCEASATMTRGPEALWAEGWRSARDTDRPGWPRRWTCPACVPAETKPQPAERPAVSDRTVERLALIFQKPETHPARARVFRELARLGEVSQAQAQAYGAAIDDAQRLAKLRQTEAAKKKAELAEAKKADAKRATEQRRTEAATARANAKADKAAAKAEREAARAAKKAQKGTPANTNAGALH